MSFILHSMWYVNLSVRSQYNIEVKEFIMKFILKCVLWLLIFTISPVIFAFMQEPIEFDSHSTTLSSNDLSKVVKTIHSNKNTVTM